MQPTIVKEMLQIFKCRTINSNEYIQSSMDVSCEDDLYSEWKNYFYLPILGFWIILFPLFCLIKLIINSKKLDNPDIKLFFGFFYLGYKPNYYYWEFVTMYRKIVTIFVTLMPESSILPKGYIILFLNTAAFYFQRRKSPFNESGLNDLELKATFVSTITILIGVFYMEEIGDIVQAILFGTLLVINIYFLINWLKLMFLAAYKSISNNFVIRKFCPHFPAKLLILIKG